MKIVHVVTFSAQDLPTLLAHLPYTLMTLLQWKVAFNRRTINEKLFQPHAVAVHLEEDGFRHTGKF